ncbi:MAG TPA: hypothetical protein VGK37_09790 [Casimicrobiaceae bacterium]|jgi:hypothetical protein
MFEAAVCRIEDLLAGVLLSDPRLVRRGRTASAPDDLAAMGTRELLDVGLARVCVGDATSEHRAEFRVRI